MLEKIIAYSLRNKLIILLLSAGIIGFGLYSLSQIPIGAVPDVTNNQVQIITTSRNLATEDVEKFLTYPVELEMANLPGVKEIRSVSKFGLSVVTIVFEDNLGTFLPRQLIAEKIKAAEEKIPAEFGKPFMGPISTGLGEIYQYTLEVDSSYKSKYDITDLRTIQDWIVKRQLAGIPGVVEVNTWGGYLKQYEVAIHPDRLKSLGISVSQVYEALTQNNQLTGGGYIEKNQQAYFIRAEGLAKSLEDIENIIVENRSGQPIYVKDLAKVGFGHANRFGAITGNGEGEKVLGQVMMLKDANSSAVIDAVKKRVDEIAKSLPPGVRINPFLERSELIGKTTSTIAENLILGCLIVIFVVVLLLGNLRSGLVVASVIPMSLLFALSLMNLFGVDANLMSLGAIDFGIIIDGAVIIVEFIAFTINRERKAIGQLKLSERQKFIDQITLKGASKMMHSAVFGQIIIIIVFIPILSLVGVEGKMFRPMALVFCFALIGALILGLTYVPVMASMFIKPSKNEGPSITRGLLSFLEKNYTRVLFWVLKRKVAVLGIAIAVLLATGLVFSRMGGEFVPTLDEGDFVIQPVLKTGTSLSETIEITTKLEKILKRFPEVEQVVSRIGAAEVPTDPMSMEESDVIIKLRPKNEWKTVETKDELADAFNAALTEELSGISFEFTQPIEMRFNELITGVRADLAVKIFGPDLDVLYRKALEIEKLAKKIDGAADVIVEKVAGLPQMTIQYDRQKMARYGVNVEDVNELVAVGFAGKTAGVIFEGEKQFDLVLTFESAKRQNLSDLENLTIELPDGSQIPLKAFAHVSMNKGPAKISRDNTKRRIVVSINVRGRDLASVAQDVEKAISQNIKLPVGYTVEYGGQLENFKTAKNRLMIAVPIALVLIFTLLYFAFKSLRDALIIFSAIPMAAVGGVFLLFFRDLPFSISAGVGFIALFGIAVLNGIVLIEEFKELKEKGVLNLNRRIVIGTKNRLRPVLLTASAAALGFLPMAVSGSAGAEVQRPLATVVVGGLVTATILTLLLLPILYALFEGNKSTQKRFSGGVLGLALLGSLFPQQSWSQVENLSIDRAIEIALKNNGALQASELKVKAFEQLIPSALNLSNPEFYYNHDQNNIAPNNLPLHVWGASQQFKFPTVYAAQRQIQVTKTAIASSQSLIKRSATVKGVSQAYYEIIYWQMLKKNYLYLDSIYSTFERAATLKFEQGASNYLEKLTATTKRNEVGLKMQKIQSKIEQGYLNLNQWLQSDSVFTIEEQKLSALPMVQFDSVNHPFYDLLNEGQKLVNQQYLLEKQQFLPEFNTSFFYGLNNGSGQRQFVGFQVGVVVPLWYGSQKAITNSAATVKEATALEISDWKKQLMSKYMALLAEKKIYEAGLQYYAENGKHLAEETLLHATQSFENGDLDYLQFVQLLENSIEVQNNYLTNLYQYNQVVLEINYLVD